MLENREDLLDKLQHSLEAINVKRKKLSLTVKLMHWVPTLLILGIVLFYPFGGESFFADSMEKIDDGHPNRINFPVLLGLVLGLGLLNLILFGVRKAVGVGKSQLRPLYKEQIMKPMVTAFGPDVSYSATGCVPSDLFKASQFQFKPYSKYEGDDLVKGQIGETTFQFSEIRVTDVDVGADGKRKTSMVFKGLFFVADFHKHFKGQTFVVPNMKGVKKLTYTLGQKPGIDRITLENPEFETLFDVYSTGPIEARYIITPAMMEAIIAHHRKCNKPIHLSFTGTNVNIAFSSSQDLFEPKLLGKMTRETLSQHLQLMETFIGIVEELNLNTRIWTKGSA